MENTAKRRAAAKKRKFLAAAITIGLHLALLAVMLGDADFTEIKRDLKETFKTEEVSEKA